MAQPTKKRGHKKHDKPKRAKDSKDKGARGDNEVKSAKPNKKGRRRSTAEAKPEGRTRPAQPATIQPSSAPVPATLTSVVDFWFDPTCEWSWLTSRWLLDVQEVRPIKIVFHLLSLSVLDEGRDLPPEARSRRDAGWAHGRVALAVGEQFGQEQLAAFYAALGTRIHARDEGLGRDVIEASLADVGLPAELAESGWVDDNDDALRRSHAEAMQAVGFDSGSPVIRIHGAAFCGPIFSSRPHGEEAGQVFDAVARLDAFPGFLELNRLRPAGPTMD
jgi:hypothetical protein